MSDGEIVNSERAGTLGKRRTWWHPLLVRLLNHLMGPAYEVLDEVPVGRMPLRVDILLIRREQGRLSDAAVRDLGALVPLLNRFTLVEFKGPTDDLEPGDLGQLMGCAFLWHSQQSERIRPGEVTLVILAPRLNGSLQNDLDLFGWRAERREPGVFSILGPLWTTWMVETDVMGELVQPVLSLVSRPFLKHPRDIMQRLSEAGRARLACYVAQLVHQFYELGEEFAMQHAETEYLGVLDDDMKMAILEMFEPEELVKYLAPEERLRGLPPEERLRGLPPEERLRGLPPEERLRGLSEEELDRMRELLERRPDA